MPICIHELASISPPNPLPPLTFLCSRTALKIFLCRGAPISALTHPHTSTPPPLKMLPLPLHPHPSLQLLPPAYHPHAHIVPS
ncbi:hypothetical protein O181_085353 [Austropuccinia psidii MF-1]|uniref:Uncharacterized protein n=1 Tax=Austropuccinia psidii MF-1 TaxID=1389203 RepID=A0A9Q3FXC5_9BASI|nr:hypothetical protein [Austropuccinia psidii MF-1]